MKKASKSGTRSAFVRSIDSAARTLEAVASTEAVDSYGTILRCSPESVDLARFNANPVLLAFHDDNAFPVGQCLNVRVEGGQLLFTASFDDITDNDRAVWAKYEARTMRGFSVRFIATEQQTSKIDGRDVVEYTRWELLEISCVPIPANPEALRRSAGMGAAASDAPWEPGPPTSPGPGPQAKPHADCGCIGANNPFLGFIGDAEEKDTLYNLGH